MGQMSKAEQNLLETIRIYEKTYGHPEATPPHKNNSETGNSKGLEPRLKFEEKTRFL